MSNYSYVAIDPQGVESRGTLDVSDQAEALRRIKEMGLFPTKVLSARRRSHCPAQTQASPRAEPRTWNLPFLAWGGGIGTKTLTAFTRQLATLVEAGMPAPQAGHQRTVTHNRERKFLCRSIGVAPQGL